MRTALIKPAYLICVRGVIVIDICACALCPCSASDRADSVRVTDGRVLLLNTSCFSRFHPHPEETMHIPG
ncbi:hypothetical protein B5X24_HaOG204245 [Helicoverpa armigera]|nr:hypothetical protein B5X24_HaOG204245 [Helicoverpa armigera]